ncbi:MAG: hypothetical protein MUC92_03005 [Fimbriimonadaceae bacterium]|jgi:hypothetical protein|nr:hypothetical protein [Fimbriimonadaceae bacterium]
MMSIIFKSASAKPLFGGLALFVLLTACTPTADTTSEIDSSPGIILKPGTTDPKLAGAWKTPDGKSKMDLRADGTLELVNEAPARGGGGTTTQMGKWSVESTNLQLDVPGTPMVYGYTLKEDGTLLLKHRRVKEPLTYVRDSQNKSEDSSKTASPKDTK